MEKHDPYAAHVALLDQYTDKEIHDVVAYLETCAMKFTCGDFAGSACTGSLVRLEPGSGIKLRMVGWTLRCCRSPPVDSWPTYNGDYSGRRFSTLTKINDQNVKSLSLAWMYQLPRTSAAPGGRLAGTPMVVNGVMYITSPDKVWALDARTGRELWAYTWTSKGGIHLGNRGVGISGNSLYFETPDCNLVSLNLADGK